MSTQHQPEREPEPLTDEEIAELLESLKKHDVIVWDAGQGTMSRNIHDTAQRYVESLMALVPARKLIPRLIRDLRIARKQLEAANARIAELKAYNAQCDKSIVLMAHEMNRALHRAREAEAVVEWKPTHRHRTENYEVAVCRKWEDRIEYRLRRWATDFACPERFGELFEPLADAGEKEEVTK